MASRYAGAVSTGDHDADTDRPGREDDRDRQRRTPLDPVRTCPNCGAALADRSCKLFCPTPGCGYYLSCSDFY